MQAADHRVDDVAADGTEDRILSIAATADALPGLIDDLRLVRVAGGRYQIGSTGLGQGNSGRSIATDKRC